MSCELQVEEATGQRGSNDDKSLDLLIVRVNDDKHDISCISCCELLSTKVHSRKKRASLNEANGQIKQVYILVSFALVLVLSSIYASGMGR